jgi:hypothetical protein
MHAPMHVCGAVHYKVSKSINFRHLLAYFSIILYTELFNYQLKIMLVSPWICQPLPITYYQSKYNAPVYCEQQ